MLRSCSALVCLGVLLLLQPSVLRAADHAADEAAIRALIAQMDAGKLAQVPRTDDRVFWSGAYERPFIGDNRSAPTKGEAGVENRVPGSQRAKSTIHKLVVSDAGDMAWDYSDSSLSGDLKNGSKYSLKNASIRVWKKEGGQWKLAALFSAPLPQ